MKNDEKVDALKLPKNGHFVGPRVHAISSNTDISLYLWPESELESECAVVKKCSEKSYT